MPWRARVKLTAAILVCLGAVGAAVWYPRRVEQPAAPSAVSPRSTTAAFPAPAVPPAPAATPPVPDEPAGSESVKPASPPPASIEEIVSTALPAVVRIETPTGFGSGFYLTRDSIVTNAHVVSTNPTVMVRQATGAILQGTVFSIASDFDLAIVRVRAADASIRPLAPGSALRARAGRDVVALGSPLGLQNTVTRGIVSAVRQVGPVMLVQTDAAINPGNSGGPVLDRSGEVIAIATMSVKPAEGHGLSFGVAIEHAQALLEGRLPTRSSGSPIAALNQAMAPQPAPVPSQGPDAREQGERAFEQTIGRLRAEADVLDSRWRSFVPACYLGPVRGTFERPWFALFDPNALPGVVSPGCEAAFADVKHSAAGIQDGVRSADEAARQAGVYPGVRRDVLQRNRLGYDSWIR